MDKQKNDKISFNVKGVKKDQDGNYIGLVLDNGGVLQYKDEHNQPIPLNKELINELWGTGE